MISPGNVSIAMMRFERARVRKNSRIKKTSKRIERSFDQRPESACACVCVRVCMQAKGEKSDRRWYGRHFCKTMGGCKNNHFIHSQQMKSFL